MSESLKTKPRDPRKMLANALKSILESLGHYPNPNKRKAHYHLSVNFIVDHEMILIFDTQLQMGGGYIELKDGYYDGRCGEGIREIEMDCEEDENEAKPTQLPKPNAGERVTKG